MHYDVIIVGAGPAGLSFARSLENTELRVAVVEKQSFAALADPAFDGRDIALTHRSVRILRELGVWEHFPENEKPAIREARVLDGTSPYSLTFNTKPGKQAELGYIVSNHLIRKALLEVVQAQDNVELLTEVAVTAAVTNRAKASIELSDGRKLDARLLVAADSRFSETRRMIGIPASMYDFGRVCIVCRMEHEIPHDGIAFECFHYGQTLAVLPLTRFCSSIVVTAPMDQRDAIMDLSDAEFGADTQRRFEGRYGAMSPCTERFAYPLVGVHAKQFYARRFALIGDAAVGMHPVTAHGYNLGLSGQEMLANEVVSAMVSNLDIGGSDLLARYQRNHRKTTIPMFYRTNGIVKFFTDDRLPAKLARKAVLRLANRMPPLKAAIRSQLTEPAG